MNEYRILILIGIPLIFGLLQYYGFPLLDKCSFLLWEKMRIYLKNRKRKKASEYDKMVQDLIKDKQLQTITASRANFKILIAIGYAIGALFALMILFLKPFLGIADIVFFVSLYSFCVFIHIVSWRSGWKIWKAVDNSLQTEKRGMHNGEKKGVGNLKFQ